MCDYWREFPPVHELVALALEYKPPAAPLTMLPMDRDAVARIEAETMQYLPAHLRHLM